MALFSKTPMGGGVADVIRCDEQDYLIWKWHPQGTEAGKNRKENAIRFGSSLRVKEGSVAVFVYSKEDGTVQDYIEGPFDEVLETKNLPIISSIIGLGYEGGTPFQAEVYFINLARIIQIKFAVPYFDVCDPRFLDYAVPTAVRGTMSFSITDYMEFIKLHRLDNFGIEDFEKQVKDAIVRYVKSTVANAPADSDIPVIQLERKIEEINDLVAAKIKPRMAEEFGVTVSSVDIADIDVDKTSDGYRQLKEVTQDITTKNIKAEQKIGVFERAAGAFVDIKEDQYARHKKTKESSSLTKVLASAVGDKLSGMGKKNSGATPPPIPTVSYHVASNGQPTGPFDLQTLAKMKSEGTFNKDSLVWKEGMAEWVKAETVEDLQSLFPKMPPIPNN